MFWVVLIFGVAVGVASAVALMRLSGRDRRAYADRQLLPGEPPTSLLAVQVVVLDDREIRGKVEHLVKEAGETDDLDEKTSFFRNLSSLLQQYEHSIKYAYWDAIDGHPDAVTEFKGWVEDIQAYLAFDEQELGDDVDGYRRLDSEKTYVAVSVIVLIADRLPPVPEAPDDGWLESTMVWEALDAFRRIDYRHLQADAVFIAPANEEDGLSELDLADESWSHLKMVS